jgi:signal peptidase
MKILFNTIYYLFILGLIAVSLMLLTTFVSVGGIKVKVVKSGSMEPAIKTGAIVVIKPESSYKTGDIITFGPDTKTQVPTTHRIVSVTGEGRSVIFKTKGDANDSEDPNDTRLSDIHGKVIFSLPYVGFILDFAKKPFGFALLVGLPAISIIIDEVINIITEIKKIRRKKREEAN